MFREVSWGHRPVRAQSYPTIGHIAGIELSGPTRPDDSICRKRFLPTGCRHSSPTNLSSLSILSFFDTEI